MDSICPICGIQIQGFNSNFKRHVQSHGDLPYKCHVCDKSFARSDSLRRHMMIHNDNSVYYDCETCDKKFKSNSSLCTHVKNIHEGLSYSCEICLKSFAHKKILITT